MALDREGTGRLVRLALRRDRILLPAWIGVFVLMAASSAAAVKGLYPDVASRVAAAEAVNSSPALVAMFGRVYDPTSVGSIALVKLTAFGGAGAAILAGMITIRHSRAEEESGRLELLGATIVGRQAPLTAALVVTTSSSIVLALLTAVGLLAAGLPAGGSFVFGASWFAAGVAFTGVAALAAQVARTARGATSLTIGMIGLAYAVRAIGDSSDRFSWLTWLSPLGWVHEMRAFADDRWIVLVLPVTFAGVCAATAFALDARRDLGAGLLSDRPGPAGAGSTLQGMLGLAWRLERGTLLAWMLGFALIGWVLGAVAGDVGSFLESADSQEMIRRLGGEKGLVDAYLSAEIGILGLVIAAYGVHAAMRLRTEEEAHRAEALLATDVSRLRWAASHLMVAFAGTVALALTAGLAVGAARALDSGRFSDLLDVLAGTLVQLPAVWLIIAIVVAAYGLGARFALIGWVALVSFVLLGEFGTIIELPDSVIRLSPFTHLPKLPGSPLTVAPLVVLFTLAAAFTVAGLTAFRQRDLC